MTSVNIYSSKELNELDKQYKAKLWLQDCLNSSTISISTASTNYKETCSSQESKKSDCKNFSNDDLIKKWKSVNDIGKIKKPLKARLASINTDKSKKVSTSFKLLKGISAREYFEASLNDSETESTDHSYQNTNTTKYSENIDSMKKVSKDSLILNSFDIPSNRVVRKYYQNLHFKESMETTGQSSTDDIALIKKKEETITDTKPSNLKIATQSNNKDITEIKKLTIDQKSKYEPILPIRSDQKKLCSKLFLGSLLPPSQKELNDFYRKKLWMSKQR